ncbi:MAG: DUF3137 domain-containing protein [Lachnospiraceae bacterium]|nr:DUF3137 domain-containing protein [Lachnospiraceae bacterium]
MMTGWENLKRKQNGIRLFLAVSVVVSIVILYLFFKGAKSMGNPMLIFFGIFLCIVPWVLFYQKRKLYRNEYKEFVVNRAAQGMFDNYLYSPKAGFDSGEIRATGIMMLGNRYHSEDMVEGVYKGVNFRRADMYIAQHVQSGKSSYTIVYLRGSWLTFTYNKRFISDLQIRTKGFRYAFKKTSRLFTREADRRHSFETENVAFNNEFECTCQEDTEAFYLLTPHVMQMLMLLKCEFGCEFMVGFVNNQLHFALNSGKNHMEPPTIKSINPDYEIEVTRRELKVITNIVDSLAIDRKLFVE